MLKDRYQDLFLSYIEGLPLDDSLKKVISDLSFINNNPEFYLYYPLLFSKHFKVSEKKENMLCVAGYLYYQATIFLDKVVDDKNLDLVFLAMICQEESVKILSDLFPLNSEFWIVWNQRKEEYREAIRQEKEINKNPSYESYCRLATLKSSFGNCAIDGMFHLSSNKKQEKDIYKILLQTHSYFSVAYQINDDVLDFINDYKNNQFNWCIYNFDKNYFNEYSIEDCKKVFYLKGYVGFPKNRTVVNSKKN